MSSSDEIQLPWAGGYEIVHVATIFFIEADDKMTCATTPKRKYPAPRSLSYWTERFPDRFLRIHKSHLIAVQHIERIDKGHVLAAGKHVRASRKGMQLLQEKYPKL